MSRVRTAAYAGVAFVLLLTVFCDSACSDQKTMSREMCWIALKTDHLIPIKQRSLVLLRFNSHDEIFRTRCTVLINQAIEDYIWVAQNEISSLRLELVENNNGSSCILYEREPEKRSIPATPVNDPTLIYALQYIAKTHNQEKRKERDDW